MTQIVSIHSYRGGTGKSNLSANLAASMALLGKRVALVDRIFNHLSECTLWIKGGQGGQGRQGKYFPIPNSQFPIPK
jgi:hypothetical protein